MYVCLRVDTSVYVLVLVLYVRVYVLIRVCTLMCVRARRGVYVRMCVYSGVLMCTRSVRVCLEYYSLNLLGATHEGVVFKYRDITYTCMYTRVYLCLCDHACVYVCVRLYTLMHLRVYVCVCA